MLPFAESFLWIEFENNFFYLLFGCLWARSEPSLRGQPPQPIENNFFYLLFGCLWARSELSLRGQPLQPILITPFYQFLTWESPGVLWKGRVPKPGRALGGF